MPPPGGYAARSVLLAPRCRLPQSLERADRLAAIHRRLWRDLGFAEPEPAVLPLLPSLLVGWADGRLGERERARIEAHAGGMPEALAGWLHERLDHPPGPYFRYQVLHLLTFMVTAWRATDADGHKWALEGEAWAEEILREQGWLRRLLGRASAEREELEALHDALHDHEIFACDRIWALARGAHAEGEPVHTSLFDDDGAHARAVVLQCADARIAVAAFAGPAVPVVDTAALAEVLARTSHLHETERWAAVAGLLERPASARATEALRARLEQALGFDVEEVDGAELRYLEDALAADARWMEWRRGPVEELLVTRERVVRRVGPGHFDGERGEVEGDVGQQLVSMLPGLAFRTLTLRAPSARVHTPEVDVTERATGDVPEGEEQVLRLATPVLTTTPVSGETLAWLARALPVMMDPARPLVLDASRGTDRVGTADDTLSSDEFLIVEPWVWSRAACAMGAWFFTGRRKTRSSAG
jgi:hypothetical protein